MSESLRKECGPNFAEGHPKHCKSSPKCEHNWFYDFRVNRRRYRATTETANKQEAKKFAAKERSRTLEGRRGIRQQSDITFKTFANTYLTDYAEQHKRSVDRDREIIAVLNRAFGWRCPAISRFGCWSATRTRRTRESSMRSSPSRSMGRIWAERKIQKKKEVVDGRRLELPTSALRTRRSPN